MSGDALEQAFYYSLGLAQQGVPAMQIRMQLQQSGWPENDIRHILYRVEQQLSYGLPRKSSSFPPSSSPTSRVGHPAVQNQQPTVIWDGSSKGNESPVAAGNDPGHVSKAFRHLVLNMTDQTLDLAKVNFMGPILLVFGGIILLAGLLGLLFLVASNQGESIKLMQFPVIIGVTFVKAGIDTYLKKPKS